MLATFFLSSSVPGVYSADEKFKQDFIYIHIKVLEMC